MKNIFILDDYVTSQTNGIGSYINELLHCSKNSINNVIHIVLNSNSKDFTFKNENEILKILYPCMNGIPFVYYPQTIIRLLKLYIEDSANNIFIVNHSPCSELLKTINKWFPLSKLVFIIHDMFWINALSGDYIKLTKIISKRNNNNLTQSIKYLIERFDEECEIFKITNLVVCLCEDTKHVLSEIYQVPKHKICLIRNGLKDRFKPINNRIKIKIRQEIYCDNDEKIIIYVGRVNEAKGVGLLLKAFKNILKIYPKIRLVLIGKFQLTNKCFRDAQEIISKITITGHIEKKELDIWYSIADVGIIPSFYEQCPYAGIEMLMYGLPIVSTDVYGVRNMFCNKNSEVAMLSKVKTIEDKAQILSRAVLNVVSSPNRAKELSWAAREFFIRKFEVKHFAKRYETIMNSL